MTEDGAVAGELAAVCAALARAEAAGEAVVLATVVRVDGSAYRRPGARMVIDGARTVGLVSGGCLEADLAERARGVLAAGAPAVVVYDTAGADDAVWGLGLGCDGAVHVLLEPLAGARLAAARRLHGRWRDGDHPMGVATVIRVDGGGPVEDAVWRPAVGDRIVVEPPDDGTGAATVPRARPAGGRAWPEVAVTAVAAAARAAVRAGRTTRCALTAPGGAPDDGSEAVGYDVLCEVLAPPPALLVCGGGPDAQPVVAFAAALGWRVTVVDHRPGFVTPGRFPGAAAVRHVPRDVALGDAVALGPRTAAAVMSHDYARDLDYLDALVAAGAGAAGYVGLLGPARRRARLWADLCARRGWPADAPVPPGVHGPAGLDLGGDGPAAIALAIVAEAAALRAGRAAGALRDRRAGIHDPVPAGADA